MKENQARTSSEGENDVDMSGAWHASGGVQTGYPYEGFDRVATK